ncbi:hypothetical protein Ddye_016930 [Dipteronia dyeriana]|uniref:Uncharacterized protein n=1 Tax=Dipteronia dyeriana TaxID=168575 RepID=A0AAD9X016_9ROSI|nr:hypothetical protein Ddye_016930 [Dipteronia dyeriana]
MGGWVYARQRSVKGPGFSYLVRLFGLFESSSSFLGGQVVSIVSDTQVAVSWIHNEDFSSLDQVSHISFIRSQLKSKEGLQVIFTPRMFNSFADSLAKIGSEACGDFLYWM